MLRLGLKGSELKDTGQLTQLTSINFQYNISGCIFDMICCSCCQNVISKLSKNHKLLKIATEQAYILFQKDYLIQKGGLSTGS